jgi:hypothetical protein
MVSEVGLLDCALWIAGCGLKMDHNGCLLTGLRTDWNACKVAKK